MRLNQNEEEKNSILNNTNKCADLVYNKTKQKKDNSLFVSDENGNNKNSLLKLLSNLEIVLDF